MILAQFVFKVCTLRFNACTKTCTLANDSLGRTGSASYWYSSRAVPYTSALNVIA